MKITDAQEHDGMVTASVRFPDGLDQTVTLPAWATKKNIKDEAKRLRDQAENKEKSKKLRDDLTD